ncbi:MAG: methionyl-tRNA formyltransferase [Phycisphaerae bacterium]|nr:methionyl-tRNA formyltransferase [Phycisphaerae bacterium]
MSARRLRIVFLGSGAFGVPTLRAIRDEHDVLAVVTQPDRPAGRGRTLAPTPIAAFAQEVGLALRKMDDVNLPADAGALRDLRPDAFVVIAFGQKLAQPLLQDIFAINLHASLLPKLRGAAPINWAMIEAAAAEEPAITGVSVISVAQRMDAGLIYAQAATEIDPLETCGELHDRLAALGPAVVLETLAKFSGGALAGQVQDEGRVTKARKLRKEDGRIDLRAMDARTARCRIHGLTPWPGCDLFVEGAAETPGGQSVRLLRVRDLVEGGTAGAGVIADDGTITCLRGRLEVLELQPPGGKPMTLDAYRAGRPWRAGMRVSPIPSATPSNARESSPS